MIEYGYMPMCDTGGSFMACDASELQGLTIKPQGYQPFAYDRSFLRSLLSINP